MADRASSDHSLAGLLATNVLALVIAWLTGMSLRDLMLVYWIQSVVIGATNVIRILKLHQFSTDGLTMNNKPVAATPVAKWPVAGFFAMHYGIFHLVYFIFITSGKGELGSPLGYVLCALAFAVNHGFSLVHNLESDAAGRPNLGTLMFMPYARIIPMHLTILSGALFGHSGIFGFLLFGALKTGADAAMHTVEHHLMAQGAAQDEGAPPTDDRPPSTAA